MYEHVLTSITVSNRPPTVYFCPLRAEKEIRKGAIQRRGEKVNKTAGETASITTACSTAHSDSLQR